MDIKIDFIEQLPIEVSAHIFQFLNISSLYMCSTVSKKWRKIIIDLQLKYKFQCSWKSGDPKILKRKGLKY